MLRKRSKLKKEPLSQRPGHAGSEGKGALYVYMGKMVIGSVGPLHNRKLFQVRLFRRTGTLSVPGNFQSISTPYISIRALNTESASLWIFSWASISKCVCFGLICTIFEVRFRQFQYTPPK